MGDEGEGQSDSVILEEEIDPNYVPTGEEVCHPHRILMDHVENSNAILFCQLLCGPKWSHCVHAIVACASQIVDYAKWLGMDIPDRFPNILNFSNLLLLILFLVNKLSFIILKMSSII